ncbi:MAG: hypothetical protein VX341_13820 [Bdellovibrionota bacterium]|nr:hypothetical protein [Bdellovibrionota bacterium]
MLKLIISLIFSNILMVRLSLAQTSNVSVSNEDSKKAYYYQQITSSDPKLKNVFEHEKVRPMFDVCVTRYKDAKVASEKTSKILECVWKQINQDDQLKEEVLSYLNEGSKTDEEGKDLRKASLINLDKEESKTVQALRDFYNQKLEEALYGGPTRAGSLVHSHLADQTDFLRLQKTQLGKNIVATLTSYCIEADYVKKDNVTYPLIYEDKDKRNTSREKNISSLNKFQNTDGTMKNSASYKWSGCIASVQHMCHQVKFKEEDSKGNMTDNTDYIKLKDKLRSTEVTEKDLAYTKQRACEVTEYIIKARTSLGAIDQTMEKFEKHRVNNIGATRTYSEVSGKGNSSSIDELTSITSKELIANNSGNSYAKANKEELDELSECMDLEKDKIINPEACKKFLNTNQEDDARAIIQMKAEKEKRAQLLATLIEEKDTEKIKELLLSDGYEEGEAEKLAQRVIDDKDGMALLIQERYENRMDALIESTTKKMNAISVIEINENNQEAINKLKDIRDNLKNKTKEFAELVHFNNIVTSYLDITDGDGKTAKNIASAKRELSGNIFSDEFSDQREEFNSQGNLSGLSANGDTEFRDNVEQSLNMEEATSSDNAVLNVNDINKNLLNLDGRKKENNEQ